MNHRLFAFWGSVSLLTLLLLAGAQSITIQAQSVAPSSIMVAAPLGTVSKGIEGAAQQEDNLAPNPSFEDPPPASWSTTACGVWDGDVAHSGTHSVRSILYFDCAGQWWTTVTVPDSPPDYTFSIWYENSGTCNNVTIQYDGFDQDGSSTIHDIVPFPCSGTWTQGVTTIPLSQARSGTGKPTHNLKITLLAGSNLSTKIWWDDIELLPQLADIKITNFTLTDAALSQYPPLTQPETTYELKQSILWVQLTNLGQLPFNPPASGGHYTLQIVLKGPNGKLEEYDFSTHSSLTTLETLPTLDKGQSKSVRIDNMFFFTPVQNGKLEVFFKPDSTLNLSNSILDKDVTVGNHPDSVCSCTAEIAKGVVTVMQTQIPGASFWSFDLPGLCAILVKGACKTTAETLKELSKWAMGVWLEHTLFPGAGKVYSLGTIIGANLESLDIACLKLLDWMVAWTYEMMRQGFSSNLFMTESPVYPLIVNSAGQRTGFLENGQLVEEIPESHAAVIGEKHIIMYEGQDAVTAQVVGYATGTMNMHAVFYQANNTAVNISYNDVQVTQGMKATLLSADECYTLETDTNGDGTVDQFRAPDAVEHISVATKNLYLPLIVSSSHIDSRASVLAPISTRNCTPTATPVSPTVTNTPIPPLATPIPPTPTFTPIPNTPPVANNQNVTTAQNNAKSLTLTASDANNDPLIYSMVSNPTHGALSGTLPNLSYTPNAGFNGTDSFTFKANDGKADSNIATVSISVTPAQPTITIQFSAATFSVNESAGTAMINVSLSATSGQSISINYATSDGTATTSNDYAATSGTLIFNPGETSKTFTVGITDDHLTESNETVNLALSTPNNVTLGAPISATLTIVDNDEPPPLEVPVYANQEWRDTSTHVQPGSTLAIEYLSGLWSPWPGGYYDGRGVIGTNPCQVGDACILFGVAHASLIGSISVAEPFYIGNGTTFVVQQETGQVSLHINDSRISDNSGSLTVRVRTTYSVEMPVYANQEWQDTGVWVQLGDTLTIEYLSGLWSPWPGGYYDGRGVIASNVCQVGDACIVFGVVHASLIGRIGSNNAFYAGNGATLSVQQAGNVLLHINDTQLGDNSGDLTVRIRVTH